MRRPKLKKASKRMTCHKRFKIQKKVREHNRKVRKEAKKKGHKRPKKDIGVPNAAPFKEQVLREAEQRKQRREELKKQQKLDRQKELEKKRKQEAKKKDTTKVKRSEKKSATERKAKASQSEKKSPKFFCKELKRVIEASDVVLEVLDARDPLGSRCPQVEKLVSQMDGEKKILLVLNKIDLIPKENLEKWLDYLNQELPTIAFKSAMQQKDKTVQEKKHTKRRSAYIDLSRSSLCFGSECLLKLLRDYSATRERVIQVGVVGFPNTGKSSVINSLKEVRACNVGPFRGLTKCLQIVHINKQIRMLDSPCIIPAPSNSALALALRSTADIETENLVGSVDAILKRCSKQQIMLCYNLPDYRNSLEFLTLLAQKRGMLKKGGLPDTECAAKLFLYDWTGAKVSYYSRPPEAWTLSPHLSSEILAATQQAFNLQDLEEDNKSTIKGSKHPFKASSIAFQSSGFTEGIIEESEMPEEVLDLEKAEASEEEEEEEEEEELTEEEEEEIESDIEEESNRTANGKTTSEELKANNADLGKLPTGKQLSIEKTGDLDDAYDFNTDYM